jgi:hypothetical protein
MDTHVGAVRIVDDDSNPAVVIDGNKLEIRVGPPGRDGLPVGRITLDGSEAVIRLMREGAGAKLLVSSPGSEVRTEVKPGNIRLQSSAGGYFALVTPAGISCWSNDSKHADIGTIGLSLRDAAHRLRASVTRAGVVTLRDNTEARRVEIRAEQADLQLFDSTGKRRSWMSAGGRIRLYNTAGKQTFFANGSNGNVAMYDGDGQTRTWITADGRVRLYDGKGENTIFLDGVAGDILLAGGDCAENFRAADGSRIEPGTVVVSEGGEEIAPCEVPYDKRAVGVVAGAGDNRPGIRLAAMGKMEGQVPVALMGRVHCKVDASYGALQVGDPLTTSPTVGHAMRATDPSQAFGSVLAKALGPLDSGRDLVPALVTLR